MAAPGLLFKRVVGILVILVLAVALVAVASFALVLFGVLFFVGQCFHKVFDFT